MRHSAESEDRPDATGLRVAVVVSRYHDGVTSRLLDGARGALVACGASSGAIEVLPVPGSFEIGLAVDRAAKSGRFDAIVALGCLIQGETTHMQVIADEVSRSLGATMRETGIPVGFGVLTVDTMNQALERAGGSLGNKGEEAALAAIRMHRLVKALGPTVVRS